MNRFFVCAGAAVIVMATGVAWYVSREGSGAAADASDPELVALGATVYVQHCAACHGRDLEGGVGLAAAQIGRHPSGSAP